VTSILLRKDKLTKRAGGGTICIFIIEKATDNHIGNTAIKIMEQMRELQSQEREWVSTESSVTSAGVQPQLHTGHNARV